jgi:tRNA pseudouridine13 synthase
LAAAEGCDFLHSEDALPRAAGGPAASGRLRERLEDFLVEELPLLEPEGEGGHLWLWVEKRNATTPWAAQLLAERAGCAPREVGFAGMKDRRAVTRQWFSLPVPGLVGEAESWEIDGLKVLRSALHSRKLRRGALRGNRFVIRVRGLPPGALDQDTLKTRLTALEAGVPNYFGPQRFGRRGDNVARLLRGRLPRQRGLRGMLLSAGRAWIFNRVLAARVQRGCWSTPLAGDLMVLAGSRSHFHAAAVDDTLLQRCADGDVHPSGPLWGRGASPAGGEAAALERAVAEESEAVAERLASVGLEHARRALRLAVQDLEGERDDEGLRLSFSLPAGGYATSVLRELISFDSQSEGAESDD